MRPDVLFVAGAMSLFSAAVVSANVGRYVDPELTAAVFFGFVFFISAGVFVSEFRR